MNMEFIEALHELEKERGISADILFEAIEAALISAYKKNFASLQNVRVHIDRMTGEFKVFARKNVVDEVEDSRTQVSLEEARKIDPNYAIDDVVEYEVTPREFGRIAAQTAKQVVVQRIREAERGMIYDEYINREGDIVTGVVQRYDQKNVIVDLGKVEAILTAQEQIPGETYQPFERIKTFVVEVKKTTKGPQVMLSRTHPGLIKRLFELEVPEIHDGLVEIKGVSREAGARSKIAVYSRDPNVDPVGACVGPKGSRVQTIVTELKGEKIDIVNFSTDPEEFVANALSPAKVVGVYPKPNEKVALVVVPDYQLSLAIGKEGQNARLAAKLTNWKIDIKSESQALAQNLIPEKNEELGEFEEYDEFADYAEYEEYEDYNEYEEYSEYDEEYEENAEYDETSYDENYDDELVYDENSEYEDFDNYEKEELPYEEGEEYEVTSGNAGSDKEDYTLAESESKEEKLTERDRAMMKYFDADEKNSRKEKKKKAKGKR
ncbi:MULTISPECIES: transcription termination factor NusA [Desulfitobacterium]|uniref:Transcription termination/antitermination protein NusA n=1 Tax=Desulfitobacterium dehalogenans (strain ATCC 51507 / DSM 9161 / JW/IU-DC1) TaxID=756499 RepID=I4ABP5_DESDJ|nr:MULTISPECIES: transcription termination factor NusA [Desulfitobacterium]AFM01380.1 NusA antitermination factor [Desulfitobacterium dehalogenans ATCC 51507]